MSFIPEVKVMWLGLKDSKSLYNYQTLNMCCNHEEKPELHKGSERSATFSKDKGYLSYKSEKSKLYKKMQVMH